MFFLCWYFHCGCGSQSRTPASNSTSDAFSTMAIPANIRTFSSLVLFCRCLSSEKLQHPFFPDTSFLRVSFHLYHVCPLNFFDSFHPSCACQSPQHVPSSSRVPLQAVPPNCPLNPILSCVPPLINAIAPSASMTRRRHTSLLTRASLSCMWLQCASCLKLENGCGTTGLFTFTRHTDKRTSTISIPQQHSSARNHTYTVSLF